MATNSNGKRKVSQIRRFLAILVCCLALWQGGCSLSNDSVSIDEPKLASLSQIKAVVIEGEPEIGANATVRKEDLKVEKVQGGISISYPEDVKAFLAEITTIGDGYRMMGFWVQEGFVENVRKEFPNWPTMAAEEQLVGSNYTNPDCGVLSFEVKEIRWHAYYDGKYKVNLMTRVTGTLSGQKREIIWRKTFQYNSREFNRAHDLSDVRNQVEKIWEKEGQSAAKQTVLDFIAHLKNK